MKKISLLTGFLAVTLYSAQIKFEKGYIINNSGDRKEVLIKNADWKYNPTEFQYKSDDTGQIMKESIKNIKEFGIEGSDRYVRKTVMIDHSSADLNRMSIEKNPEFKEETLFLKYLVDGKAGLLYYEDGNTKRLFYTVSGSEPQQLVYKPYYVNGNTIHYNEDYKKQISENLKCNINNKQLQNAEYVRKDLTKIFLSYNECSGGQVSNYAQSSKKKNLFHLSIRPGISFSSFETSIMSNLRFDDTKFGNKSTFRIGTEVEYVLPFNKNKWAIFAEPTYQYYKNETVATLYSGTYNETKMKASVDYKSIDLPIGIRHYLFLNDESKIFINAAYSLNFNINSSVTYENNVWKIKSANNFAFGAGYKYKNKYSAEFRVGTSRDLLRDHLLLDANYKTVSVILGYTLF
ncbi:PorT family protein [Chryseobacterium herbae]|uniref:PorT family protein n=1 Tax=Chryseobacterium herbae TaxID=2976476 RepID=A0ABT2IQ78_9FLAO|nr:PorT family protein [Chryseobacterium sp. pc1-10]MCT2560977.1 PorT family protein [Chryseobacterium sp. pc1-10]